MKSNLTYEKFFSEIILSVRYIQKDKSRIVEGQIRAEELHAYLTKFNLPLSVWLSEDGSGIVPKAEYDTLNSQLVGQVLPFDEESGIPIKHSYMARTAEEIEKYLKIQPANKATLVYIIVAQPLKRNVPPFVLSIFGTDNKFTSDQVSKRWQYTKGELARYGCYGILFKSNISTVYTHTHSRKSSVL